jgi:hypothetical protein
VSKTTSEQRSAHLLERAGYVVGWTTHWLPAFPGKDGQPRAGAFGRRIDLWGFCDLIAVHPEKKGVLFVQTTAAANMSSRVAKYMGRAVLPPAQQSFEKGPDPNPRDVRAFEKTRAAISALLRAGNDFHIHGWDVDGRNAKLRVRPCVMEMDGGRYYMFLPAMDVGALYGDNF